MASGRIPVVAAMDDYEDEPIPAEWCAERRQYGYHDSVGRWVSVETEDIAAYAVDYQFVVAKMLMAFERAGPPSLTPLIDGLVWDVGTVSLAGAKEPVPVWFARCLRDPAVWASIEGLFERRPPEEVRIILTSTRGTVFQSQPIGATMSLASQMWSEHQASFRSRPRAWAQEFFLVRSAPFPDRPYGRLRDRLASREEDHLRGRQAARSFADAVCRLLGQVACLAGHWCFWKRWATVER